jgi:hypothetical protein
MNDGLYTHKAMTLYITAHKPMARMPEVVREKIFLAGGIHCCLDFFHGQPCYIMKYVCVCVYSLHTKEERLYVYYYINTKLYCE